MPCKHYKDALIEAAASASQPLGDLRAHLADCAACRATFAQEQALFSSIDPGLHVIANAEVPSSLLPRVCARLNEEFAPRRIGVANWLVLASAAAMVLAFFVARAAWRAGPRQNLPANSARTNPSTPVFPPSQEHMQPPEPHREHNPRPKTFLSVNSHKRGFPSTHSATLEVLVPQDQEVLLAEYAEQRRLRKRTTFLAQDFDASILAPLQVAPIQIDELGVKLLAEEKLQ